MHSIEIAGNASNALTHFALLGLATIAEENGAKGTRLSWTKDAVPHGVLTSSFAPLELAELVRSIAVRWSEEASWVNVLKTYGGGTFSPFSPRIKGIDAQKFPNDWKDHQGIRLNFLDDLLESAHQLDLLFISALGEPSYWHSDKGAPRPDHGASRWEMKTRNRGEEFVQNRLSLMVKELSKWSTEEILSGITGETTNDSLGKMSPDSRTSTGFTPPGPTDVAFAFIGLLGMTSFPLSVQTRKINSTPGALPHHRLHPTLMVLPMASRPMSLGRIRSAIVSGSLDQMAENIYASSGATIATDLAADAWLVEHGIDAVSVFEIKQAGSSSAPERQVQPGTIYPLGR